MKLRQSSQLDVTHQLLTSIYKPLGPKSGWSPKCKSSSASKQHFIRSSFQKLIGTSCTLQFSMCTFVILVDNCTPILVMFIDPISTCLCLVSWRLALDAMKMRDMKLPRISLTFDNHNTFWIK